MIRVITFVTAFFAFVALSLGTVATADDSIRFQASVNQFAVEHGKPLVTVVELPVGTHAKSYCGQLESVWIIGYCGYDEQKVYIGADAMSKLIAGTHPLAEGIIRAHEYGHHIWLTDGVTTAGQPAEDYADCVGGAWLAWESRRTGVHVGIGDLPALGALVDKIKRNEKVPGDIHGTFIERSVALGKGYFEGLGSCDWYKQFAA